MGLAALRIDLEGIVAGVDEVHGGEGDDVAQCCYEIKAVFLDLANSDRMMRGRRYRAYRVSRKWMVLRAGRDLGDDTSFLHRNSGPSSSSVCRLGTLHLPKPAHPQANTPSS
jgi:hypothetical protein